MLFNGLIRANSEWATTRLVPESCEEDQVVVVRQLESHPRLTTDRLDSQSHVHSKKPVAQA